MQIKTTMRSHFILIKMASAKQTKKQKISVGKDVEKSEPLCITDWRECKMVPSLQKTVWWFLKKIENRITMWSGNFISGYIPKRTESKTSKRHLYTHSHSIITSKGGSNPSVHQWMNG